MILFKNDHSYTITRSGCAEDWLNCVKALLFLLGNQSAESPLQYDDVYHVCSLISDMLPDEEMVRRMEKQCKN